ncbi:MAG: alpha/beta hydrolase [Lysobacteraceae bacterium]
MIRTPLARALLLALLGTAGATEARSLGRLDFAPCNLPSTSAPEAVEAQCTTFRVPENPADPQGRQIDLAIAWVPADGEAEPDPVFLLAGGPGQSAKEAFPQVAGAFRDVLRARHVILVDQRGTGGSAPLSCKDEEGNNAFGDVDDPSEQGARAFAERCLADLSKDHDVRFYTTTEYVADLEAVRAAIGAERINLYGGSYGTRVGQQYAKAHPERVRTLVIDSVVPTDLVLGSEHAKNLEAALDAQWARCAGDAACAKAVPDAKALLAEVREALSAPALAAVRFRDPTSGAWREEVPTPGHLAVLLRFYSYSPLTATLLPVVLKQAHDGDYAALLAQAALLMDRVGGSMMHGMQLSVSCSEDADELQADPANAGTLLGDEFVTFTRAQCAVWPRGQRPADFREPLTGDLPVLAISGEFDPVTPPRYGDRAIAGLPNARHLVLKGQGHTPIGVGCMPKLFAQFIESADAKGLDAACLDRLAPLPPGTGLHGWGP